MGNIMKLSIGKKLIVAILAVNILGIVALTSVIYWRSSRLQTESALDNVYSLAEKHANQVQTLLDVPINTARSLAQVMELFENVEPEMRRADYNSLLRGILEANPDFLGVWTGWEPDALDGLDFRYANRPGTDATGRFIPYWYRADGKIQMEPLVDYDVGGDGDYYQIPLKTGREAIIDPFLYSIGGKDVLMTTVAVPIKKEGSVLGVVGIDIAISDLQTMVEGIKPFETGVAAIFSNSGIVAAHFDASRLGKQMRQSERDISGRFTDELANAVAAGRSFSYSIHFAQMNTDLQFITIPFTVGRSATPWSFAVGVPMDKVLAPVASMLNYSMLIGFVVILLISAAVALVTRSIVRPIRAITSTAERIAGGDLDADLNVAQKDEVGVLAEALRSMVGSLKISIADADKKAGEAEEKAHQCTLATQEAEEAKRQAEEAKRQGMLQAAASIERVVERMTSASEELSAQVEEASRGAEEQRNRTDETATAMEEMNATVLEVARNASHAAEGADNARSKAHEGAEVVGNAVQAINQVQEQAGVMSGNLGKLGQQAEQIGRIMNVIEDIADQTNLLALNAAIEAARAGDAGRGFAVVADEVRKLAEKTMNATKEVGQAITAIQEGTNANIKGMEKAGQAVGNATGLVHQSGDVLEEIVKLVEETSDLVRSIATAAEEQSAASEEINRSVDDINRISSETSEVMNQSAHAISELAREAVELQELVQRLKQG